MNDDETCLPSCHALGTKMYWPGVGGVSPKAFALNKEREERMGTKKKKTSSNETRMDRTLNSLCGLGDSPQFIRSGSFHFLLAILFLLDFVGAFGAHLVSMQPAIGRTREVRLKILRQIVAHNQLPSYNE